MARFSCGGVALCASLRQIPPGLARAVLILFVVLIPGLSFGDYIYWSDNNTGKIQFGDTRGSGFGGPITYYDFTDGLVTPRAIALDLTNRQMYWSDASLKRITRANLDWISTPEVILDATDGLVNPKDLALDIANDFIYWADASASTICRSALDGSGRIVLFDFLDGLVQPVGVAIDVPNSLIYWADANASVVRVGNIGGLGLPLTLFDSTDGLVLSQHVALNLAGTDIYWTNIGSGSFPSISRGNVTGLGSPVVLFDGTDGLDFPERSRSTR